MFIKISQNPHENTCARVYFFTKVAGSLLLFIKKRLWHRFFSVNYAKFLRTPFLQNTSGWLLLRNVFELSNKETAKGTWVSAKIATTSKMCLKLTVIDIVLVSLLSTVKRLYTLFSMHYWLWINKCQLRCFLWKRAFVELKLFLSLF